MDSMKIQTIKARGTAIFALINTVMLAVVGGDTDNNIWFRIAAFAFMGVFANITITRTIAASIYSSAMVTAQVVNDVKANR